MSFTKNRFQDFWEDTKPFIKQLWPLFTDVELKHINGNYDTFLKYLNELYNNFPATEAIARDKLKKFFNYLEEKQFQKK